MKKLFSFCLATLLSASMFASRENVPNPSDLASLEPSTNVVACFYFDGEVCNDIVMMGDYNGWDSKGAVKMRELEGFDGWYVAAVKPDAQGADKKWKPVQLKSDGSFSWDYQCGDEKVWVKANPAGDDFTITSKDEAQGECGLHYTQAGAYIYYCTAWKNGNSPCGGLRDYEVRVYPPACEWVAPTIAGGFDSWADVNHEMDYDYDAEMRLFYYFVMENQGEGIGYKIKGGEGWGNPIEIYVDTLSQWKAVNDAFNGGKDWQLGEDTLIIFDWSDSIYRYQTCEEPIECDSATYVIIVKFPACDSTVTPAIIGSFLASGWNSGVALEKEEGVYSVEVKALCTDEFKFRDEAFGWANQIMVLDTASGNWNDMNNIKFGEELEIELDFSGENYRWSKCEPEAPLAFEKVETVLVAKKQLINGNMVIIREDGKKFNVLGAEMK